jgi:hypothetical protein
VILGLNSGCEIFDKPRATVFGCRCGITINRVGREMVSDGTPGGAGRADSTGSQRHSVEKSENAGSQF